MVVLRVAAVLALAFGVVGVAACAAGAYGVWRVQSRLERANTNVFNAVDRGLGGVQDRVPAVQKRVRDAKVTAAEVAEAAGAWAEKKAQDRLVAELEIESRVEKLSGHLQAVDLRLEASTEAVRDVRRAIEIAQDLGADVDPAATDGVLELLGSLRDTVGQAEEAVDGVRRFAIPGSGESVQDRLARVAKVLARILLTLTEVDRRLDDFAARLAEARGDARQLQARTSRYILLGSAVCYGLLAWVAAGQVALCRWGWRHCRRGRLPTGPGAR